MLKVSIASDLHLEHADIELRNVDDASLLVLAGDICTAANFAKGGMLGERYRAFFDSVSKEFPAIVYVLGNHEYYGTTLEKGLVTIRDCLKDYANISVLNNQAEYLGKEYTILGTTLWTDYNNRCPMTMLDMPNLISDYKAIRKEPSYRHIIPKDLLVQHDISVDWLKRCMEGPNKTRIIVTHHAPSFRSVPDKYKHETIMNGAFASNLDSMVESMKDVKLWIHGHMHDSCDYMLGDTCVVCNPKGYPGEDNHNNYRLITVEV